MNFEISIPSMHGTNPRNGFANGPHPPRSTLNPPGTLASSLTPGSTSEPERVGFDHSASPNGYRLLIAAAESYLETAHSNSTKPGFDRRLYQELVITGLRFLEVALHQFKLPPKLEAMVRLRYASVLDEETDNLEDAEEALHKGILIAQKNQFLDLKFSMQHLLVRIMFRVKPKVSLLLLNDFIQETQDLGMTQWTYAFRFLLCNLRMDNSQFRDENSALSSLRHTYSLAKQRQDFQIHSLAYLMEAVIHLGTGAGGTESARKSLDLARSVPQSGTPQIEILCAIVDTLCFAMEGNGPESEVRIKKLHILLDAKSDWEGWAANGDFSVTVNSTKTGKLPEKLIFRWIPKGDVNIIGWYLGGVSNFHTNGADRRAEKCLREGLELVEASLVGQRDSGRYTAEAASARLLWRGILKLCMQVEYCFLLCARTDWETASQCLRTLQETFSRLDLNAIPKSIFPLIKYLSAIVYQGTGNLRKALEYYQVPIEEEETELGILSILNAALITSGPKVNDPKKAEHLLNKVESIAAKHPNLLVQGAFFLVRAALERAPERANNLRNYLIAAQRIFRQVSDHNLLAVVLSMTCRRVFNPDPNYNLSLARASFSCASKSADALWMMVNSNSASRCFAKLNQQSEASHLLRVCEKNKAEVEKVMNRGFEHHRQYDL